MEAIPENIKKLKIAVLCGGTSTEREVSLRSGEKVFKTLIELGINTIKVDIRPDLILFLLKEQVDLVFIILHGTPGEDGTVQGMLELFSIPYTGSGVLASALAIDKLASKKMFIANQLPVPPFFTFHKNYNLSGQLKEAEKHLGFPLVLKPVREGSSIGVKIFHSIDGLEASVLSAQKKFGEVFLEKFIKGKCVTVGIIEYRGKELVLPILELRPKKEFYDYEAKYTAGLTEFIIPAQLEEDIYKYTQEVALSAYRALGCRGFARVDIMVSPDGVPFILEVNTLPGLTDLSDLPAQAKAESISYSQLIIAIIESAISIFNL